MNIGEVIKSYRELNNLSMDDFAVSCSLSKGYISMLENNVNPRSKKPIAPTISSLSKIADGMGIDLDELLKMLDNNKSVSIPKRKAVQIPVYERVAAGIPIEMTEDVIDTEEIPEKLSRTGTYFGIKIKGESMEPRICDGDVVIVRQQEDADSGDIVIVTVNGTEATCKRLRKYDDKIALLSNNPVFEPIYFSAQEVQELPVKIIGKVVELRGKF